MIGRSPQSPSGPAFENSTNANRSVVIPTTQLRSDAREYSVDYFDRDSESFACCTDNLLKRYSRWNQGSDHAQLEVHSWQRCRHRSNRAIELNPGRLPGRYRAERGIG